MKIAEEDLPILNCIMTELRSKGYVMPSRLLDLVNFDESRAHRIVAICKFYGVGQQGKHADEFELRPTDSIQQKAALDIFGSTFQDQQQKAERNSLFVQDLKLCIKERKRNKWLSIAAIAVSLLSLAISIFK
jgi:hypothetical protein|nr:MAG TPA: hypothetical protein [Caudoviricetes sp.]